jgi:hypothetical protein
MLHAGLVMVRMGVGADVTFAPPLWDLAPERRGPPVPFSPWWRDSFVRDQDGRSFNRSDFVLGVANQDGGAHIDRRLRPAYAAITRGNSLGVTGSTASGAMAPLGGSIAHATVRQIAFELDVSLREQVTHEPLPAGLRRK